jgi:NAD-dependent deacetylase
MRSPSTIEQAAQWLLNASYAVAFTGAGISTPSGIPDFRSADSGLWEHVDPMQVASIFGFRHNPRAFYDWVRPLAITTRQAEPNPAHLALAAMERAGLLKSVITQNIDMLHTRAGSLVVRELHGHMRSMTCIRCFHEYDAAPYMEALLNDNTLPACECGGVLKPNVILFGEQLPFQALQQAKDDARKADVMLVVGSSLEVEPASSLPLIAKRNGSKIIIINLQPTFLDSAADLVIHENAAHVLPQIAACMKV